MNVENFRRTLQYADAHPEKWDQSAIYDRRPPKFCFVGIAAHLSSELPNPLELRWYAAMRYLDITQDEEDWLSSPDRTLDDFRRVLQVYGRYA